MATAHLPHIFTLKNPDGGSIVHAVVLYDGVSSKECETLLKILSSRVPGDNFYAPHLTSKGFRDEVALYTSYTDKSPPSRNTVTCTATRDSNFLHLTVGNTELQLNLLNEPERHASAMDAVIRRLLKTTKNDTERSRIWTLGAEAMKCKAEYYDTLIEGYTLDLSKSAEENEYCKSGLRLAKRNVLDCKEKYAQARYASFPLLDRFSAFFSAAYDALSDTAKTAGDTIHTASGKHPRAIGAVFMATLVMSAVAFWGLISRAVTSSLSSDPKTGQGQYYAPVDEQLHKYGLDSKMDDGRPLTSPFLPTDIITGHSDKDIIKGGDNDIIPSDKTRWQNSIAPNSSPAPNLNNNTSKRHR